MTLPPVEPTPVTIVPPANSTACMGRTETLITVGPYVLVVIVWGVFIWLGARMSSDAKDMGHSLFSILLLLINPAKQFVQSRRKNHR